MVSSKIDLFLSSFDDCVATLLLLHFSHLLFVVASLCVFLLQTSRQVEESGRKEKRWRIWLAKVTFCANLFLPNFNDNKSQEVSSICLHQRIVQKGKEIMLASSDLQSFHPPLFADKSQRIKEKKRGKPLVFIVVDNIFT